MGETYTWILSEASTKEGFTDAGSYRALAEALRRDGLLSRGSTFDFQGTRIRQYLIMPRGRRKLKKERPVSSKNPRGKKMSRHGTFLEKWLSTAITRKGKLGGKGFLSKPRSKQKQILDQCVAQYGYRSCLGSVMVLERIPQTQAKYGRTLGALRRYLVKQYGGPGSFGPRKNPGKFTLVPEVSGCPLCEIKTNPEFEGAMKNVSEAGGAAIGGGAGALLLGPLGAVAGGYLGAKEGKKKKKKKEKWAKNPRGVPPEEKERRRARSAKAEKSKQKRRRKKQQERAQALRSMMRI